MLVSMAVAVAVMVSAFARSEKGRRKPSHAAFGGYKQSGIGRENHKMMLDHYQQTKNLLVSYSDKALGFF